MGMYNCFHVYVGAVAGGQYFICYLVQTFAEHWVLDMDGSTRILLHARYELLNITRDA